VEAIMKRSTMAAVVACGMLLAAAVAARAERFEGVKYLGGVKGFGPRAGTLVIENGMLRFEDRKGREVFARSLESASAWVGTEKRASFGRVLGGIALLPVGVFACGLGGGGNPWVGGTRKDSPIAMVKTGTDSAPLRLRVPFVRLRQVVEAVGRQAARTAADRSSSEDPPSAPSGSLSPVSN
jgi:hypothetical protein